MEVPSLPPPIVVFLDNNPEDDNLKHDDVTSPDYPVGLWASFVHLMGCDCLAWVRQRYRDMDGHKAK